ncbi:tail fiber domain-containing protein [Escherichia coli]|uniref:tail fiber domain-containing protein n=1 Tax=Escherichia coli TaxID=562 RepID=UPI0028897546|nr:tail fiber domain-containing protein [Escherichia coli]
MSFSGGAGWVKLATVTMPQASSIVYIALIGGAGYNVGSPQQAGISELVLRAGNGNPKGITGALWKRTAVGLTNFAWINTSGDKYDIYVEIGNYATSVNIHWDCTANASVSVYTSPTYSASKPSGVTDGVVYTVYSSHQKPTPSDIGALPTTGGTISGPLAVTGGITGTLNGNASTATKLQTARTIGGVSFDGTANINLPGVNTAGNQSTTGNAATATKLQTARRINNVAFDGTKDITLTPGNIGAAASSQAWLNTGDSGQSLSTSSFITLLQNNGAFNQRTWIARCSWAYANNASIPDSETKCGTIPLAGALIEITSFGMTNYTIRITTATTTSVSGAKVNAEFIYVYNGDGYSPGWRRQYNTKNLPTPLEIGTYSISEINNLNRNFLTSSRLEAGSLDANFQTLTCYCLQIFDIQTTTDSPNMFVSPIAGYNMVFRSTSSRRYKTDIESLEDKYADELLKLRPVWYRSTCERDRKDWGHYGLIAEEVGEIAPQYVHWRPLTDKDDPGIASDNGMVAEGVMYDRLVVPLIHHIQKLTKRVDELESELKLLSTSRSDIG